MDLNTYRQLGTILCHRHLLETFEMNKSRMIPDPFLISEDCPRRRINFLFSSKWTSMVLYILNFKVLRTSELMRAMPGISKKMLTQTLRELEELNLIHREIYHVVPPKVEYSLTDLGQRFVEPLLTLYDWAEENSNILDEIEKHKKSPSSK